MWKFTKRIVTVFFIILLAAVMAILLLNADVNAQSLTGPSWAVVFRFKPRPAHEGPEPDIRLHIHVDGRTEGEAAINAHKALSEKLTSQATERLDFLEAQQKRK